MSNDRSIVLLSGHKTPRVERIAYSQCPGWIQARYDRRTPLYVLREYIAFNWNGYHVQLFPGIISDLASVPWWTLISRTNADNWMDLGAIAHDGVHFGLASFPELTTPRQQRTMNDLMLLDLWRFTSGRQFRPWVRYRGVRLAAPFLFKPDPALAELNLMSIHCFPGLDTKRPVIEEAT
jgi:hypothetical protein